MMKKLLLILLIISACKKNNPSPNNSTSTNTKNQMYATLSISRSYIGALFTDSILSTSWWANGANSKGIPILSILDDVSAYKPVGYEDYNDQMAAVVGDVISLHLELKHSSLSTTGSGIWVVVSQTPNGVLTPGVNARFMCVGDTISQTITYLVH